QNRMVTEAMKVDIIEQTKKFFAEKGYLNVHVAITESKITSQVNTVALNIVVFKGSKVRINQISFAGNDNASALRLKRTLKGTKEMPRLSFAPAYSTSIHPSEHLTFRQYMREKGYLYPSRSLNLLDPYFRYNI